MALTAGATCAAAETAASAGDSLYSLNIVLTESTEGELNPCGTCRFGSGGLPRRSAFIQTCRDTADFLVVADAGNFRLPGDQADPQHDRFMLEEMVAMGYRVAGVGENDLRHGIAPLRELVDDIDLTLVSANIVDAASGEPLFAPYHVLEVGPARIGFTGVLEPLAWEPYLVSVPGVEVLDPLTVLPQLLMELREQCDLVICFCQIHHVRLRGILESVEGIDIAVPARRPSPRNYPGRVGSVEQVFYAGYGGRFVGWTRAQVGPDGIRILAGRTHHLPLGAAEDEALRRRVYEFLGQEDPGDPVGLTPQ